MTDTIISSDQTVSGIGISSGDALIFDPEVSATVTVNVNYANTTAPANNIINEGILQMGSPDPDIHHRLRINGIIEANYVGGPPVDMMNPPSTDPGLWVIMGGKLNWSGAPKVGWNRTGSDPTWRAGDELRTAPFSTNAEQLADPRIDYLTYALYTGAPLKTYTMCDGSVQVQEVMNLTRNVHFEGTVNGQSHIMFMSDEPQIIDCADIRWCSPNKFGRYSLHFHRCVDGSRGSTVNATIMRDGKGNGMVTHESHGITAYDTIVHAHMNNSFWYDETTTATLDAGEVNAPDDLLYDHCWAASKGGSVGFQHEVVISDNHNEVRNCLVTGVDSAQPLGNTPASVACYHWPSDRAAEQTVWNWHDNVAHNNKAKGIRVWQNDGSPHIVRRFISFNSWEKPSNPNTATGTSGGSIDLGAYRNGYDFKDGVTNDIVADEAVAKGIPGGIVNGIKKCAGQNWIRWHFNELDVQQGPFSPEGPTRYIECFFHERVWLQAEGNGIHGTDGHTERDFIRCDIDIDDPWNLVLSNMNELTITRFQNVDGTAYRLRPPPVVASPYPLIFDPIAPFALRITTPSLTLGSVGNPYSHQLTAGLGVGQGWGTSILGWSLAPDSAPLPAGFQLSASGLLTCPTPAATPPGGIPVKFRVEDSSFFEADRELMLVVGAAGAPLQITTTSLDGGIVGSPYSDFVLATGGQAPRTFARVGGMGPFPPGLGITAGTGEISGEPTTPAPSNPFTIRVTDALGATDDQAFNIAVADLNPVIDTVSLVPGEVDEPYSQQILASLGTPPYVFSVQLGPIPPTLMFSPTGLLSGDLTTPNAYPVRIRVTDAAGRFAQRDYTIQVYPPFSIVELAFPDATVGQQYVFAGQTIGGVPTAVFDDELVGLPPGLVSTPSGVVSGVPTTEGIYPFDFGAQDGIGVDDLYTATITVLPAVVPVVTPNYAPNAFTLRDRSGGSRVRDRVG